MQLVGIINTLQVVTIIICTNLIGNTYVATVPSYILNSEYSEYASYNHPFIK